MDPARIPPRAGRAGRVPGRGDGRAGPRAARGPGPGVAARRRRPLRPPAVVGRGGLPVGDHRDRAGRPARPAAAAAGAAAPDAGPARRLGASPPGARAASSAWPTAPTVGGRLEVEALVVAPPTAARGSAATSGLRGRPGRPPRRHPGHARSARLTPRAPGYGRRHGDRAATKHQRVTEATAATERLMRPQQVPVNVYDHRGCAGGGGPAARRPAQRRHHRPDARLPAHHRPPAHRRAQGLPGPRVGLRRLRARARPARPASAAGSTPPWPTASWRCGCCGARPPSRISMSPRSS